MVKNLNQNQNDTTIRFDATEEKQNVQLKFKRIPFFVMSNDNGNKMRFEEAK